MSAPERVNLLLVDDVEENLVALRAILEPLDQNLVNARSGEEALRALLHDEFACILLDVQMPELDGFETATLIKQRERTRHVPIIFLTALSKEEGHVFRGYSAGAVDYLFKPFEPELLRSKVAVFVDLHRKTKELERQAELLRERELAQERRVREERYRQLADAMPQIVWTSDRHGRVVYYNRRWFDYTGEATSDLSELGWTRAVHPDDLPGVIARREQTLVSGEVFEAEFRLRAAEASYRWHLGRAVPIRGAEGEIDFWVGTATDIHDHKRTQQAQLFLLGAGDRLASTLDYVEALREVARAAVPAVADWCTVHLLEDDTLEQVAVTHVDPQKLVYAEELQRRYPPTAHTAALEVVRTAKPQLAHELSEETIRAATVDDLHFGLVKELGLRSLMSVPLVVRDRILGAITFATAESERLYDESDLAYAEELGRRAAAAVENARLYAQAEEQARAARVLAAVADAVVLVDNDDVVRLWNRAATTITGIEAKDAVGRPIAQLLPAWHEIAHRIPVAAGPGEPVRAETVPVEISGREVWVSGSGVGFDEGTVYAFRDLTEERALEQMRSDFVATVSHELRTPLAAIYGAALTIRRPGLELDDETARPPAPRDRDRVGPPGADHRGPPARELPRLREAAPDDRGVRPARARGRRAPRRRDARAGERRARAGRRGGRPLGAGRPQPAHAGARQPPRQRRQVLARRAATCACGSSEAAARCGSRSPTPGSGSPWPSSGGSSRSSTASTRTWPAGSAAPGSASTSRASSSAASTGGSGSSRSRARARRSLSSCRRRRRARGGGARRSRPRGAGGRIRTGDLRDYKSLALPTELLRRSEDGSRAYCRTWRPRWCWSTFRLTRWSALSIVFVSQPSSSAISSYELPSR